MQRAPRFYYGWIIVAIASFTMMVIIGIFFTSGVLFAAIVSEFGWSRTTASLPFSIGLISYAATAWLAGRLFDAYGPRWLFPLGALCMGGGLVASAQATTVWHLCLGWGVLAAQGFNLAGFAPHLALVSLWFERRRGTAAGLVLGGASLGALVVVPLTQYFVDLHGWRWTYAALGVATVLILAPLNALWQRHRPQNLPRNPDQVRGRLRSGDAGLNPEGVAATPAPPSLGLSHMLDALRTARFWFLFVSVCSIGWLSNITTVHQLAHMVDSGFAELLAAWVIGATGLLRAFSSTLWGSLSDRFGREPIYTLGTVLCMAGIGCLAVLRAPGALGLLYGYALGFGIGYGVHGSVQAAATADLFPARHLGAILGLLELGWGLGGFGGAWLGGYWYDRHGGYHGAFVLTVFICAMGCLGLWLAAPRRNRLRAL